MAADALLGQMQFRWPAFAAAGMHVGKAAATNIAWRAAEGESERSGRCHRSHRAASSRAAGRADERVAQCGGAGAAAERD